MYRLTRLSKQTPFHILGLFINLFFTLYMYYLKSPATEGRFFISSHHSQEKHKNYAFF